VTAKEAIKLAIAYIRNPGQIGKDWHKKEDRVIAHLHKLHEASKEVPPQVFSFDCKESPVDVMEHISEFLQENYGIVITEHPCGDDSYYYFIGDRKPTSAEIKEAFHEN